MGDCRKPRLTNSTEMVRSSEHHECRSDDRWGTIAAGTKDTARSTSTANKATHKTRKGRSISSSHPPDDATSVDDPQSALVGWLRTEPPADAVVVHRELGALQAHNLQGALHGQDVNAARGQHLPLEKGLDFLPHSGTHNDLPRAAYKGIQGGGCWERGSMESRQ